MDWGRRVNCAGISVWVELSGHLDFFRGVRMFPFHIYIHLSNAALLSLSLAVFFSFIRRLFNLKIDAFLSVPISKKVDINVQRRKSRWTLDLLLSFILLSSLLSNHPYSSLSLAPPSVLLQQPGIGGRPQRESQRV